MARPFETVQALRPGRSVFDLSYDKKLTMDMGQLVPVMCDEMVPGDVFKIAHELVIRFQPLVAPILHEINAFIHVFFVPYRILWDEWEDFITGGPDGDLAPAIPEWEPTNTAKGSLWDYLGFPVGVDPDGAYPLDFVRRAYNRIYNEFYRDQTSIAEVVETNESILIRAWEKDYFTSALPWQQRGTAPALPISGTTSAVWAGDQTVAWPAVSATGGVGAMQYGVTLQQPYDTQTKAVLEKGAITKAKLDANTVSLASATTFDVADLRLAFQLQRWLERNARAGARYTEFLKSHFGVAPRDDRLQRPEYLGGMRSPVIVSEVLQTSSTDATTPQANMAGHGISAGRDFTASYRADEFGLVMAILSVMPRPAYQQGINRQWLRRTKYDFYFPEFAHLSEQAVLRAELFASGVDAENNTIFGYQGRYDEMRSKHSMVCDDMRDTYDYWHLSRQFVAAPALNQTFLECVPDKRIFAAESEPGLIVNCRNVVKAIRPLPISSEPGRIDH